MTRPRDTDELVHDLARDLRPVRPIARLRSAAASVVLLWAMVVVANALLGGGPPHPLEGSWAHLLVLVGLGISAAGGVVAALAAAVPGRERPARSGRSWMGLGIALTLVAGGWGALGEQVGPVGGVLRGSSTCFARALGVGLPPLLVLGAFVSRGAASRIRVTAGIALVGAVALGAAAIHAICPVSDGLHVLLGHCLTPLMASALLAIPMAALLARSREPSTH